MSDLACCRVAAYSCDKLVLFVALLVTTTCTHYPSWTKGGLLQHSFRERMARFLIINDRVKTRLRTRIERVVVLAVASWTCDQKELKHEDEDNDNHDDAVWNKDLL